MRQAFGKGTVSLLSEETQRLLHVDCAALARGSHTQVIVRCNNCGEKFLREFRHLDHLHACPNAAKSNDHQTKWCGGCKSYLHSGSFADNQARADNLNAVCQQCLFKLKTNARPYLQIMLSGLRQTEEAANPTIDDLLAVYEQQQGRCFYTKIKLEFGTNSLRCASLAKLDETRGFTTGNIILVSGAGQLMRAGESDLAGVLLDLVEAHASHVRLESKITHPSGRLPQRKRTYDAGYDIASIHDVEIEPHTTENIDTGLIISPPEGFYYSIEGRSSLWKLGIVPCRGIIDSSYTGDLMVAIENHSNTPYVINSGDRIAQLVLHRIYHADFVQVEEFSQVEFGRSTAGFGSSGR